MLLAEKQDNVNIKLAELDEITRKIQRIIGLSDPSSHTFANLFNMLPFPHTKKRVISSKNCFKIKLIDKLKVLKLIYIYKILVRICK